jgi:hypothetical protein
LLEIPRARELRCFSQAAAPAMLSSSAATSAQVQVRAAGGGQLLELLGRVPEPGHPCGIRYGLAGVLAVAATAVLAGRQSVLAIAGWAAEAP